MRGFLIAFGALNVVVAFAWGFDLMSLLNLIVAAGCFGVASVTD